METHIFGIPMSEARDAIMFYQRFKDTPTFKETFKKIKLEHLESELEKINAEIKELE